MCARCVGKQQQILFRYTSIRWNLDTFSWSAPARPCGALAACRIANEGGSRCSGAASHWLFSRRRHSRATRPHQHARERALFQSMSKFAWGLRVHEWACRARRGPPLCYRTAHRHFGSSSRFERCTRDPHMWSTHVVRAGADQVCEIPLYAGRLAG